MSTILDTIAGHTRFRVAEKKKKLPLEELRARALDLSRNAGGALDLSADAVRLSASAKRPLLQKG